VEVGVSVITTYEETAMSEQKQKLGRREFLKKAAVSGGAAGVAAVALSKGSAEAAVVSDSPKSSGYRETEHVKTYYELAKF
jgi:nitrous oxide reductase